jgi:hypothetical protein
MQIETDLTQADTKEKPNNQWTCPICFVDGQSYLISLHEPCHIEHWVCAQCFVMLEKHPQHPNICPFCRIRYTASKATVIEAHNQNTIQWHRSMFLTNKKMIMELSVEVESTSKLLGINNRLSDAAQAFLVSREDNYFKNGLRHFVNPLTTRVTLEENNQTVSLLEYHLMLRPFKQTFSFRQDPSELQVSTVQVMIETACRVHKTFYHANALNVEACSYWYPADHKLASVVAKWGRLSELLKKQLYQEENIYTAPGPEFQSHIDGVLSVVKSKPFLPFYTFESELQKPTGDNFYLALVWIVQHPQRFQVSWHPTPRLDHPFVLYEHWGLLCIRNAVV